MATYKINTLNQPDDGPLVEVDEAEYIDLQRLGLIKPGKGDVGDDGKLLKKLQKEAPAAVLTAFPTTGSIPTQPQPAA